MKKLPRSMEVTCLGPGNYYGGLEVRVKDGKAEWSVENWDGHHWVEIPDGLFLALVEFGYITESELEQPLAEDD